MANYILICPNCKVTSVREEKCPICNGDFYRTNYTDTYWNKCNDQKKTELRDKIIEEKSYSIASDADTNPQKAPAGSSGVKILIWIGCLFIYSVIVSALAASGIILGGFPTILLFGATLYLAKKFCDGYEDSKR